MTAKPTVASTNARIDGIEAKLDQLIAVMSANQGNQGNQVKKPEQAKQDEDWLKAFPEDYGTPAQRVEWEKLADKARKQRPELMKSLGTKAIKCFIPVPKKDTSRMPHTIRWDVTYN